MSGLFGLTETVESEFKQVLRNDAFATKLLSLIASAGAIVRGEVLAQRSCGVIPTTGTAGTNTGAGTVTAVSGKPGVQIGTYSLACTVVTDGSAAATVIPNAHNTGSGTLTVSEIGVTAKIGVHKGKLITASSNAGVFAFWDPNGNYLGTITVGQAAALLAGAGFKVAISDATDFVLGDEILINITDCGVSVWNLTTPSGRVIEVRAGTANTDELGLLITDTGTNFVVGDTFTVVVPVGAYAGKYVVAGTNGFGTPCAIAMEDVANLASVQGVNCYMAGSFRDADLTWPAGITATQKANAIAGMAARGMIIE
jgi:hypothetical protein